MAMKKADPENPLPLYYQVYRSLIERIEAGEFSDGKPLPPELQLAKDYSVSRITITKALAQLKQEGRVEGQVGRGTFVIDTARHQAAPSAKNKPYVITLFCRLISHPYMEMILSGVAHVAEQHNYYLQVISTYENQGQYPELLNVASTLASNMQGAIIYLGGGDTYRLLCSTLQDQGIPIVLVERHHPSILADRVAFNDEEAAFELTTRLIEQGHVRIAVIVPQFDSTNTTVRDRLLGYRQALEDRHLPYSEDLVWMDLDVAFYLADNPEEVRNATARRLWRQIAREDVTAVLTINPDIANIITQHVDSASTASTGDMTHSEKGLTIATFGNAEPSLITRYPMIVAIHHSDELGRAAAQLLFDRINGSVTGAPRVVTIPMKIVEWSAIR